MRGLLDYTVVSTRIDAHVVFLFDPHSLSQPCTLNVCFLPTMGNTYSQRAPQDEKISNGRDKLEAPLSPNSFETSDETLSEKENDISLGDSSNKITTNPPTTEMGSSPAEIVVTNVPTSTGSGSPVKSPRSKQRQGDKKSSRKNVDNRDDVLSTASIIKDEQVLVNLAMADLMAYLQVVANNSNDLPLTRRDDPELTRMVTNLTSEEYARKSAAFIPADVRVIAGSFLKYGNVWDLPTSEEYVASDGAQEPGECIHCESRSLQN